MNKSNKNPYCVMSYPWPRLLCQALACALVMQYPFVTSVWGDGYYGAWGCITQRPCSLTIWGSSGHARLDWVCCVMTILGVRVICVCHLWCHWTPGWMGLLWVPGKLTPSSLTAPGVRLFPRKGEASFIQGYTSSILYMNCPQNLN